MSTLCYSTECSAAQVSCHFGPYNFRLKAVAEKCKFIPLAGKHFSQGARIALLDNGGYIA